MRCDFRHCLLIGVCLAWASASAAEPDSLAVRLVYLRGEGTTDCSDEAALRDAVKARLGFNPFSPTSRTTVEVRVERKGVNLASRLRVISPDEPPLERTLSSSGKDCSELSEAIALAVALAIDPLASAKPAPAPPPPPPPERVVAPSTPPTPPPPITGLLQISVLGAFGVEPGLTGGIALEGGIRVSRFSLTLEARADWPGTVAFESARVRANVVAASLLPCIHLGAARICALVQGGILRAEGLQLLEAQQLTFPHLTLGARLGLAWPTEGRWALTAHADVAAPLIRTTLFVSDTPVWTSAALNAVVALGGLVRF